MTYEIILNYSTAGVDVDVDCDDDELFKDLQGDFIFQDLIEQLRARFRSKARAYDTN